MANLWRNKGNLIGTNNREGILFINLFHRSLSTYFQGYNYPQSMVPYTGDFVMNKTNPNNPLCWGACDLKNSHLWSLLGGKLKKKPIKNMNYGKTCVYVKYPQILLWILGHMKWFHNRQIYMHTLPPPSYTGSQKVWMEINRGNLFLTSFCLARIDCCLGDQSHRE